MPQAVIIVVIQYNICVGTLAELMLSQFTGNLVCYMNNYETNLITVQLQQLINNGTNLCLSSCAGWP